MQHLLVVLLDGAGLFDNAVIGIAEVLAEESLPFPVGEADAVQALELHSEIGYQVFFASDRQVLVGLGLQALDKIGLHSGLVLVLRGAVIAAFELGDYRRLGIFGNKVVVAHDCSVNFF